MFIYLIVNHIAGKYYVGQHKGKSLKQYLQKKFYDADHGRGSKSRLYASIREDGRDAFSIHALLSDIPTKGALDQYERDFIGFLHSRDPEYGYNICRGGEGFTGVHSAETRKKISEAALAFHANPDNTEMRESIARRISAARKKDTHGLVAKVCPVCSGAFSLPYSRRKVVFCSPACFQRSSSRASFEQKRLAAQRSAMSCPEVRANLRKGQQKRRNREKLAA